MRTAAPASLHTKQINHVAAAEKDFVPLHQPADRFRLIRPSPDGSLPRPPVIKSYDDERFVRSGSVRSHEVDDNGNGSPLIKNPRVQYMPVVVNADGSIRPASAAEAATVPHPSRLGLDHTRNEPSSIAGGRDDLAARTIPLTATKRSSDRDISNGPTTSNMAALKVGDNPPSAKQAPYHNSTSSASIADQSAAADLPHLFKSNKRVMNLYRYTPETLKYLGATAHHTLTDYNKFIQARQLIASEMSGKETPMPSSQGALHQVMPRARDKPQQLALSTSSQFPGFNHPRMWVDKLVESPISSTFDFRM